MPGTDAVFLGIDVGTSGVRGIAIDAAGAVAGSGVRARCRRRSPSMAACARTRRCGGPRSPRCCARCAAAAGPGRIRALAVDGTSGTLLVTDAHGVPLEPAGMYNDASAAHLAERIRAAAPPESGAHGATSPLARLLVLQERHPEARHALHQADWIAARLTGRLGLSDDNNALKLGYDPVTGSWPRLARRPGRPPRAAAGGGGARNTARARSRATWRPSSGSAPAAAWSPAPPTAAPRSWRPVPTRWATASPRSAPR